jgi:hypothetical protein
MKDTYKLTTSAGLSDHDEEVFGLGGCWELALVLKEYGLEFAVIEEKKNYLGESEISYPHAFAVDGNMAVDVYGRVPLAKMEAKWAKLLASGKVSIVRGAEAKASIKDFKPNLSLMEKAKRLIKENRSFFFGKAPAKLIKAICKLTKG